MFKRTEEGTIILCSVDTAEYTSSYKQDDGRKNMFGR